MTYGSHAFHRLMIAGSSVPDMLGEVHHNDQVDKVDLDLNLDLNLSDI